MSVVVLLSLNVSQTFFGWDFLRFVGSLKLSLVCFCSKGNLKPSAKALSSHYCFVRSIYFSSLGIELYFVQPLVLFIDASTLTLVCA